MQKVLNEIKIRFTDNVTKNDIVCKVEIANEGH